VTSGELDGLARVAWMPSRIPIVDALAASVPNGVEISTDRIPPSHEQRWCPRDDGSLRLLIPHDGKPFDNSLFQVAPGGWDHSTCDCCRAHIAAMTLCYVTRSGAYFGFCSDCYSRRIVSRTGSVRMLLWKAKRMLGIEAAA
jgi:hypothetical protein